MSEPQLIFESAWYQLDSRKRGHIHPSELPLLVDAIEASLSAPLVSSEQLQQIVQFSKTSIQRVYKSEFKTLFHSLTGMEFSKAMARAGWEQAAIDILKSNVLTSTPIGSSGIDKDLIQPSFKKELKQYKRLSESQEKEIEYRDDVIAKLEKKEQELEKYMLKYKESSKVAKQLEDDVLYRDKIIMERDSLVAEKELESQRLRDEVKRWKEEAKMWQSQNEDEWKQYVVKKERNFNNELLSRVQKQQKQIELLRLALTQGSKQVAQQPVKIAPITTSKTTIDTSNTVFPELTKIPRAAVYLIVFIVIFMIMMYPSPSSSSPSPSSPSSSSHLKSTWYQNTWLEPWIYEWFENQSIDYDYYNLGDVNEEYLMSIR